MFCDRRRGVRVVRCVSVPGPVLGARGDASALARADERARSRAHSLWRASERPVPDHDVSRVGVDVHDGRQGHVHVHRAALLADDVADDARRVRGVRGVPDRLRARDGGEVRLFEPRDAPALLVHHHQQLPRGDSALHLRAQSRDLRRGLHVSGEQNHSPAPEIEHARDLMEANRFEEAMTELWPAARSGNADAEELIGVMYAMGLGVKQDYQRAFEWYLRSAMKGHPGAQSGVGWYYEVGLGMPAIDLTRAYMWYVLSAIGNDPDAMISQEEVVKKMTKEQIEKAHVLIDDYRVWLYPFR